MTTDEAAADDAAAPDHDEPWRLSTMLLSIVADGTRERVVIGDLVAMMHDRAFGVLMFIFAVPNIMPTPPGVSAVLGAPLLVLAVQFAIGRPRPWLPKFIARRSIAAADFARVVRRVVPWIARAEKLLKPRLLILVRPPADRLIGIVCLILAIVLFLPIPLGNMLPALAISILSLAVLERDGLAVLIGYVIGAVSAFVVAGVFIAMAVSAIFLLRHALGWV